MEGMGDFTHQSPPPSPASAPLREPRPTPAASPHSLCSVGVVLQGEQRVPVQATHLWHVVGEVERGNALFVLRRVKIGEHIAGPVQPQHPALIGAQGFGFAWAQAPSPS